MIFELSPLWLSLKTACLATFFAFVVGVLAAKWMVNYRGKLKGLIDALFNLPLVLPPTVVGFFLLLLFGKRGPLGQLLNSLGMTIIFTSKANVVAATVVAFPLMYKSIRSALEQVNPNYAEAARTLGVSELRIFFRISFPLALPGIIAGCILAFARAMGEFGATLMIAGNIPNRTQTIPTAIYFAAEGGDMSLALKWVLIIVALSMVFIWLMNYWLDHQQKTKMNLRR